MKRFAIFTMVCFAAAVLFSACGPEGLGGDGDWWSRTAMAKGVKTIIENPGTDNEMVSNYDKDGRLISTKNAWYEESITYDSDGRPVTITQKNYNEGKVTSTTTITYTYGGANKDRFLPRDLMGQTIFHLNHIGLLPGITKIEKDYDGSKTTIEFTFKGDVLTAKSTGKDEYDNFECTCQYDGAYPVSSDGEWQAMGPNTYFENGMFKTYVESFKYEGKITSTRTTTYKNVDNLWNLEEKMVEVYADGGGQQTWTYTYDKYNNMTKETRVYVDATSTNTEFSEFTYEYDSKGMWTTMHVRNVGNDGKEYNPYTATRTITYW